MLNQYVTQAVRTVQMARLALPTPAQQTRNSTLNNILLVVLATSMLLATTSLMSTLRGYNQYQEKNLMMNQYVQLAPVLLTTDHMGSFAAQAMGRETPYNPRLVVSAYLALLTSEVSKRNAKVEKLRAQGAPEGQITAVYKNFDTDMTIPFHWDDWIDLGSAHIFQELYNRQNGIADSESNTQVARFYSFIKDTKKYRNPIELKLLKAKVELYSFFPAPLRVIMLSENKLYQLNIAANETHSRTRLGDKRIWKMYRENGGGKKGSRLLDTVEAITALDAIYPEHLLPKGCTEAYHNTEIKHEMYEFDFSKELKRLEALPESQKTLPESEYEQALAYSLDYKDSIDSYFRENHLFWDLLNHGHHTSGLFVSTFLEKYERHQVISHLHRAWFEFCRMSGIITWMSYGNLIGWRYMGYNLIYDNDIDVQMPITELHRLGRDYNRTLIIEDPRFGNGKFYLDINTWIARGSQTNAIDGRFLDTRTGTYIDLSGLTYKGSDKHAPDKFYANNDEKKTRPAVVDHNNNWFLEDQISPLRLTLFEGTQSYIPAKSEEIMTIKYGPNSYTQKNFNGNNFQEDIGQMVSDGDCKGPPATRWANDPEHEKMTLAGACGNPFILNEWNHSKKFYKLHQKEMELISQGKDVSQVVGMVIDGPMLPDPYDEYIKMYETYGHSNIRWMP